MLILDINKLSSKDINNFIICYKNKNFQKIFEIYQDFFRKKDFAIIKDNQARWAFYQAQWAFYQVAKKLTTTLLANL